MVWLKLAYKEFSLPFFYWKRGGCPGGRDFVWLTTLICMILTFTFLSWGSYKSLLNQFVDVLVGKIEGHGVPIILISNPYSKGGVNLINSDVLCDTAKSGYAVHPYREISTNFDTYIELPDKGIWKIDTPGFDGWAVYPDNPLWMGSTSKDNTLPLEIVINSTMFKKYFDYNLYRQVLEKHLDPEKWKSLPEKLFDNDKPLKEIWLNVRTGVGSEFIPFEIIWTPQIQTLEKIAFLFPLTTYQALSYANRYPELAYFPDASGNGGERIKVVLIEGVPDEENINHMASVLKGKATTFRGDLLLKFYSPVNKAIVDTFAKKHNLVYLVESSIKGDAITHDTMGCKRRIWLPMERLPGNAITIENKTSCLHRENCSIPLDVTAKGDGFKHVVVYVSDPTKLSTAIPDILNIHDSAFLISPVYQDALNRFSFLSRMVERMREPYAIIIGLFLFTLLGIHISTITGHRRHLYGMLLSKGINWWQVYLMLFFQIFLAVFIGMGISMAIIHGVSTYLSQSIASVAFDYKDTLNIIDLNLMPLTYSDYLYITVSVLTVSWVLATIVLWFMPLRARTHPSLLFQE